MFLFKISKVLFEFQKVPFSSALKDTLTEGLVFITPWRMNIVFITHSEIPRVINISVYMESSWKVFATAERLVFKNCMLCKKFPDARAVFMFSYLSLHSLYKGGMCVPF